MLCENGKDMEKLNKTEDMISSINQSIFFEEFTYSENNFRTSIDNQELQLADSVVWLEDILFIIQIKDRNLKNVKDSESEENWFKSKVIKKASWQINKTISFLNSYSDITITNERGHKFCISEAPKDNIKKVIEMTKLFDTLNK